MDIKDILTLSGILLVLLVGLVNININLKNRRNVIREHIFKEQIILHYKLFALLSKLNNEIDLLFNNETSPDANDVEKYRDLVQNFLYENEFLLQNETITSINKLLRQATKAYIFFISDDSDSEKKAYGLYYESYLDLLKNTRDSIGVDKLSEENKDLHSRNNYKVTAVNKLVTGALDAAIKTMT